MSVDFAEYVAARRPRLVRTAVLLGCQEADAEDVVQTALARCLRSWRRVSRADSPDAYVHRVLVNTLADARGRRWSGELPSASVPERPGVTSYDDGLVVRRALASLSAEHRAVLVLRYFADLSERDTAAALGIPAGTVKSRTARAIAALSGLADIAALADERST